MSNIPTHMCNFPGNCDSARPPVEWLLFVFDPYWVFYFLGFIFLLWLLKMAHFMCFLSAIRKVAATLPDTVSALLLHVLRLASSQRRWLYMHTCTSANTQTTDPSALKDHLFPGWDSRVGSVLLLSSHFPSISQLLFSSSYMFMKPVEYLDCLYPSPKLIGLRITSCFWDSNSDRLVVCGF